MMYQFFVLKKLSESYNLKKYMNDITIIQYLITSRGLLSLNE